MGTTGLSITLANSIIGVGILAMPFCFQQCGVLLATVILLLMGLVSRLCCYFLLKSAILTRRRTFEFLAFHTFGALGKLAVEIAIIGFLMGTCIAYFVVVGDLGPQIISKMFNINQSDVLRTSIMVIVSLVCVLPLGLLRNVDSLSNVSAVTIGFYFCLVLKILLEAASQFFTSDWYTKVELWKPSGVLQCVPIFSMALFCQTQLFEIFESMPSQSLEKMNVVTKNALHICSAVYFTLGLFGYVAFSSQIISGNILMSLSPTMASDVIKLGFVMSLALSFPLIIFPCRASLYSLLYKKVHSTHHEAINHSIPLGTFRCITVSIIALALFVSLLVPNIELVLGLLGSTIGVLICVVFPAACFVNVTFKDTNERLLAKIILVLGLIIMVLGTYANLQAADISLRHDEESINQQKIDKLFQEFMESKELEKNRAIQESLRKKELNIEKVNKESSEVQPPNPVPPELKPIEQIKSDLKKIDLKFANKSKDKEIVMKPKKIEKTDDTNNKNINEVIQKESLNKLEEKVEAIENKIQAQELVEAIKQHNEEQKELLKEQKEVLHEIKKTQEEERKLIGKDSETNKDTKINKEKNNKEKELVEVIKQQQEKQEELLQEQKKILQELRESKLNDKDLTKNEDKDDIKQPKQPEGEELNKAIENIVRQVLKENVISKEQQLDIKDDSNDTVLRINNVKTDSIKTADKVDKPIVLALKENEVPNVEKQKLKTNDNVVKLLNREKRELENCDEKSDVLQEDLDKNIENAKLRPLKNNER